MISAYSYGFANAAATGARSTRATETSRSARGGVVTRRPRG